MARVRPGEEAVACACPRLVLAVGEVAQISVQLPDTCGVAGREATLGTGTDTGLGVGAASSDEPQGVGAGRTDA